MLKAEHRDIAVNMINQDGMLGDAAVNAMRVALFIDPRPRLDIETVIDDLESVECRWTARGFLDRARGTRDLEIDSGDHLYLPEYTFGWVAAGGTK